MPEMSIVLVLPISINFTLTQNLWYGKAILNQTCHQNLAKGLLKTAQLQKVDLFGPTVSVSF